MHGLVNLTFFCLVVDGFTRDVPAVHNRHNDSITGAIVGVGSTRRASAVRWGVAGNIVWAWVLTIPASGFVAAIAYWISLQLF